MHWPCLFRSNRSIQRGGWRAESDRSLIYLRLTRRSKIADIYAINFPKFHCVSVLLKSDVADTFMI